MTALLSMYEHLVSWLKSEKGQTTIEYILVLVLIVLVLVLAFRGSAIDAAINRATCVIAAALGNSLDPWAACPEI